MDENRFVLPTDSSRLIYSLAMTCAPDSYSNGACHGDIGGVGNREFASKFKYRSLTR